MKWRNWNSRPACIIKEELRRTFDARKNCAMGETVIEEIVSCPPLHLTQYVSV